jgi:hypothetical protein
MVYSHHDLETADSCIKQWEADGKLEILKPLEEASDQENVIKMKSFLVERKPMSGNWPTYPFGKPTNWPDYPNGKPTFPNK